MIRLFAILICLTAVSATASTNNLSEEQIEGQKIVQRLREARPPGNSTNVGTLKISQRGKPTTEIPVRFEVTTSADVWRSTYQTRSPNGATPSLRLTVTQHRGTNFYELGTLAADDSCCPTNRALSGNETMVPFAGSDFWVADLGLEFLRWPGQVLLKKDRRGGRACYVLESTNPNPGTNTYTKVVSWLDIDSLGASAQPAIIYAEAYDAQSKLKYFEPTDLQKVDGQYQLQKMQIKNLRTGSRTYIEFKFGPD